MNDMAKNLMLWVVIALVLMMVFNNFGNQPTQHNHLNILNLSTRCNKDGLNG